MAATDARPVPIKNTAFRAYFAIYDNDGDPVASAAGLDSEVSIDGAAFADCTNEATGIAQGLYYLDLTAGEMNGDAIIVIVKTSTTDAKATILVFYPQESGDIKVDVQSFGGSAGAFSGGRPEVNTSHLAGSAIDQSGGLINANVKQISGDATAADNLEAYTDGTTPMPVNVTQFGGSAGTFASGRPNVNASHLGGTAQTGRDLGANIDVVLSTRASQTSLDTVDDFLDTEIAAIKAKTDNLPSDPADASDIATATSALSTKLDTIDDFLDTEIAAILAAVDTEVAAIKAKTDNLPEGISKNTALSNFEFVMVDSADHVTPKTGLTVSAQRSIDGAAFGACANGVTEVGSGVYKINLAAADLNGDVITLRFTATGGDATLITIKTEAA